MLIFESRRDDIIIYIIVVNTILNNEFYEFIFQTTKSLRSQRFTKLFISRKWFVVYNSTIPRIDCPRIIWISTDGSPDLKLNNEFSYADRWFPNCTNLNSAFFNSYHSCHSRFTSNNYWCIMSHLRRSGCSVILFSTILSPLWG